IMSAFVSCYSSLLSSDTAFSSVSLVQSPISFSFYFFFNDPPPTELYTLSLHDALPISTISASRRSMRSSIRSGPRCRVSCSIHRSEEHTSELQSHLNLVCRLLLEKKKEKIYKV